MSEEEKICPRCGRPMRRTEEGRVCDYCGYFLPREEYVSSQPQIQEEEYISTPSKVQKIPGLIAPPNNKGVKKAKEHAFQIVTRLGLHDEDAKAIVDEAIKLYKMAAEKEIVKGRSINALVEGALYAIIKKHAIPINLDRLASAIAEIRKSKKEPLNVDIRALKKQVKSEILKNYNLLRSKIGGDYFTIQAETAPYIDKYCKDLHVSDDVRRLAREIFKIAKERRLTVGRNPSGIAAAAIYVAAKLLRRRDIQQRKVAKQAGITEVTLRNRSRELERVICSSIEEYEERFSNVLGMPLDLRLYCETAMKKKKR